MYYKQYGDTDMKVSAVGFGSMRFDEDDIRAGRLDKCADVQVYAYSKGINYFDTAPHYCDDKSEEVTGIALSQMDRNKVYVSSKTNFGTLETNHPTKQQFMDRLSLSLDRLRTDHIDFYHMWCMLNLKEWEAHMEALYSFFEDAKRQGMIKNIVFSSHMQGDDISEVVNTGKFKGMLIGYNALNYSFRQSGIEAAHKNGMGVVVMNPLGGGMIPRNPKLFEYLTEGTDLTVPEAALRFVASHKEITIALNGFTKKEHVDDAIKAVENLEEMPAADIVKKYQNKSSLALNDLCTSCGYCKGCPKDIPIPKFMDTYNEFILSGDKNSMTDRLNYHWHISPEVAKTCIACGHCERECTQHLPIIKRLEEIGKLA
ncbi:MAG: aldo/keto reductase [Lachnospiraceae bacterium]|nr:aldo/keto reductase [Lachnospiraceae bacterium]